MDKTFQKFLRYSIDLSPVGAERRADNPPYFCTPRGASVFGWAGVDGIHFCFIRGFGGMVFAVSPMNAAPNFVHPLARDFSDFLRLLLACGDVAALEQAWMWDDAQFEAFLRDNPMTEEQKVCLSEVAARMQLTPTEHPLAYIKEVQASFDYSKIRYTEEYYDVVAESSAEPKNPAWEVRFDGGFGRHAGKERAETEIHLDKELDWAGHHWVIPAAYACRGGLVMDFCMRVRVEDIREFTEKWHPNQEDDAGESLTREQEVQMEWESPFYLDFTPVPELNEKNMQASQGYAVSFNPYLPEGEGNDADAKWVMEHYNLEASHGWMIYRYSFPWIGKRRPQTIRSFAIAMKQQPVAASGKHFKVHAPGDTVTFSHPVSGTEYTLTVQKLESQTIPANCFGVDHRVYPTHYTAMWYTLSPNPGETVSVRDCAASDRPLENTASTDRFAPEAQNDFACIGIIGGADGPTNILCGDGTQGDIHVVCSSLHFEPIGDDIEWRTEFRIKRFENERFSLL